MFESQPIPKGESSPLSHFELLKNVLIDIERCIGENINVAGLADRFSLSEGHLRRLFSFTFKQSIGNYIRSRKLAASLDCLLKTNFNILDIALEYGFEYERSYIRAFKREFGITPGKLRKSRQVVKIKPPIHLFEKIDTELYDVEYCQIERFTHVVKKRKMIENVHY